MKWMLLLLLFLACENGDVTPNPSSVDPSKLNWICIQGDKEKYYTETKEECEISCSNYGDNTSCIEGKPPVEQ